ncbi:RHS repeat domain-containing protein [Oceanicoccus sagamiensis]|uniref:RHS protein conserved region domain-containing protein n=1 Tax=Oceanicoccus sagamiensis TaxID=716816 RepID=A0A1X9N9S3_9GAMM|nr:RHS repeat-associated core domain-containing protein [Oceanicoccus sagamiensis]ARN73931.1 hypothetical protein BST96_07260 [Oceanicoccus sagamiensis]
MRRITACIKPVLWVIVTVFVATTASAEIGTYYIHNDHLGTPQVVTDENQTVVWQANKKPFGETEEVVSGIDQQARFLGQYFDEESGLAYNYYRDYDPSLGRYIQSDPRGVLLDFSDPQRQVAAQMGLGIPDYPYVSSLNHVYGYAGQDPVNYIDPTGEGVVKLAIKVANKVGFDFDGPKKSKDGMRICQIRYKKKPIFRLDKHPISPTDRTPVVHFHVAPNMKKHRKVPGF